MPVLIDCYGKTGRLRNRNVGYLTRRGECDLPDGMIGPTTDHWPLDRAALSSA